MKEQIAKEVVIFKEIWDKPSKKGFPTKDSVVLTIAIFPAKDDTEMTTGGYAVKIPGDQHIPRIGRAIARKAQFAYLFDVDIDCPERHTLNYFNLVEKHFKPSIMRRLKNIMGKGEIGTKFTTKILPIMENYANCIED
ncbi:MAG: hypothetical protein J0665_13635 [Deltaproteobacteria bacterium]|nr:hypothetical protein [Deltaproteobacteria bacterium]